MLLLKWKMRLLWQLRPPLRMKVLMLLLLLVKLLLRVRRIELPSTYCVSAWPSVKGPGRRRRNEVWGCAYRTEGRRER